MFGGFDQWPPRSELDSVEEPVPTDDEWIEIPSTEAAESGAARVTPKVKAKSNRRMTFPIA